MSLYQTSVIVRKDGEQVMQVGYTEELKNATVEDAFLLGISKILSNKNQTKENK